MTRTVFQRSTKVFLGVACCFCLLTAFIQTAMAYELHLIDDPDVENATIAGLSGDGTVIIGHRDMGILFTWSENEGVEDLNSPMQPAKHGHAVNFDGSAIVGSLGGGPNKQAVRWTKNGGTWDEDVLDTGLIQGQNYGSEATGVSDDGSVVVGTRGITLNPRAWRWTEDSDLQELGLLHETKSSYSRATAVSGDGKVIVGRGDDQFGNDCAFRWTEDRGMQQLGEFYGGWESYPNAVDEDGDTIVGSAQTIDRDTRAFRWVAKDNSLHNIDNLEIQGVDSHSSEATDVSADGSIVIGNWEGRHDEHGMLYIPFRWSEEENNMIPLEQILWENGVEITQSLASADAISADGQTIIGTAVDNENNEHIYIMREQGITSPVDLSSSLLPMRQVSLTATSIAKSNSTALMDASHGALFNTTTGLSSGDEMPGRTRVWVVGTAISDSSFAGDDLGGEGGFGVTHHFANGFSIGGGIFAGNRSMETSHGGNQDISMFGPGLFVTYAPNSAGLRLEAGGTYHSMEMTLKRGYANGTASAQSKGDTEGNAYSLYGRVGWAQPISESFSILPFAQYTWQKVDIDGYTESGGPFPARFDDQTDEVTQSRLGLELQYAYSRNVELWTWAAWSHRFESEGASMSGEFTGLYSFDYGGETIDQDWGDTGIGAKWRPYLGFETFTRLGVGIESDNYIEPDLSLTLGMSWDI